MISDKKINPRFEDFLFDWDYNKYLLLGGYGSSKSYHIALKIILKCFQEKRTVLVVREVYETHRESTFSLFCEILEELGLLATDNRKKSSKKKVICKESPFMLRFPNGSKIIFRGMDKPKKLKSINGVTIVWLEEASEIKYEGYKELLGRLRHPTLSLHFILSSNPVGTENWLYKHFFKRIDEDGNEVVVLDDERLYKKKTIVKKGVYYHHSLPDDNLFLPDSYIKQLDELAEYDPDLYRTARLGRFGLNGIKVLPRFETAPHEEVMAKVNGIPSRFRFNGMDFGFETSYNAVVRMAVDDKEKILYIYWEYYKNHMTDDITAEELKAFGLDKVPIISDCAEPKTIKYYQQQGFRMSRCKKAVKNGVGSRLQNIRKVKRFKKIICSSNCKNTIRELSTLTYKKNERDEVIYDEFNIDPHTFSAIWYGLNDYTVADLKTINNSKKGVA